MSKFQKYWLLKNIRIMNQAMMKNRLAFWFENGNTDEVYFWFEKGFEKLTRLRFEVMLILSMAWLKMLHAIIIFVTMISAKLIFLYSILLSLIRNLILHQDAKSSTNEILDKQMWYSFCDYIFCSEGFYVLSETVC